MRCLVFISLMVSSVAFADVKVGSKVTLTLPAYWDDASKSVVVPGYVTVEEPGSIDTCTFYGGPVVVKKVADGKVFFDPVNSSKSSRCKHLVTTAEIFSTSLPEAARAHKKELDKKQAEFAAQLKEDVQEITEKGADPCGKQDQELKTGQVYKLDGRIYVYGADTTARTLDGNLCQVELGSLIDVQGFSRSNDFGVASYHRPSNSSGFVLVGSKREKTETCKDGEAVVFSLEKWKSHFTFAKPSNVENIQVKGLVAGLSSQVRFCNNSLTSKDLPLGMKMKRDPRFPNDHGGEPGQSSKKPSDSAL